MCLLAFLLECSLDVSIDDFSKKFAILSIFEGLIVLRVLFDSKFSFREYHPNGFSPLVCSHYILAFVFLAGYCFGLFQHILFLRVLCSDLTVSPLLFGFYLLVLGMLLIQIACEEHLAEFL